MGIELDVQGLDDHRNFSPGDAVAGSVLLKLDCSTVISAIAARLEGWVSTSLVEKGSPFVLGNDVPTVAEESHQLFAISEIVFPPPDIPQLSREYTLPKAEYRFPFKITFPRALNSSGLQLPPSFNAHSVKHRATAEIKYALTIELTRPGRLRKCISIQRQLQFRPSEPDSSLLPSMRPVSQIGQAALYIDSSANHVADPGIPVLILEGVLPCPPVVRPGMKLPLSLRIRHLPVHLEHSIPIKMRSLILTLRGTTTITAGTHHASWVCSEKLLSLDAMNQDCSCIPGVESFTGIDAGLLDNLVVPSGASSFRCSIVEQKYSLGVEAGFAVGVASKLRAIGFVINLEIWSGICTDVGEDPLVLVDGRSRIPELFDGFVEGAGAETLPCYSSGLSFS
ncbi:uncharacterized protein DSM5745_03677 [Aspergillus mulundensis]|uniref:Arrestin-like N-terminal domain-containing protein n=1 Tax=Aspergillus mulundensis TaxID=1810919 RepID=A0A3D8SL23_9EURO|nr:hypothetical protein DSM5745_03677 [Aspergillus mulundensis]RDW87035.1 hypothetical protein DSM5745_03677 [Aspergillus mulundensis]